VDDTQKIINNVSTSFPIPLPAPFNNTALRYALVGQPQWAPGTSFGLCLQGDAAPLNWTGPLPLAPPVLPNVTAVADRYMEAYISQVGVLRRGRREREGRGGGHPIISSFFPPPPLPF
jgi:hypothetical protein